MRKLIAFLFSIPTILFGQSNDDEIIFESLRIPIYKGGIKKLSNLLSTNIKYPLNAINENISGKVITEFIVDIKGNVKDISVIKGVESEINLEAIRVTSLTSGNWIPAMKNGKKIDYKMKLPFKFTTHETEKDLLFIDNYLKHWDDFSNGIENQDFIRLNSERFLKLLAKELKQNPCIFMNRVAFFFFVQVHYFLPKEEQLFETLKTLSDGKLKAKQIGNEGEFLSSIDFWSWWKLNENKFDKFGLLEEWKEREFSKETVIKSYEEKINDR